MATRSFLSSAPAAFLKSSPAWRSDRFFASEESDFGCGARGWADSPFKLETATGWEVEDPTSANVRAGETSGVSSHPFCEMSQQTAVNIGMMRNGLRMNAFGWAIIFSFLSSAFILTRGAETLNGSKDNESVCSFWRGPTSDVVFSTGTDPTRAR